MINGYATASTVHLREYVSLRMVATVDKHGIYNKMKIINEYADNGVKWLCIMFTRPASSDA